MDSSVPSTSDAAKPGFKKVEKCSENALRTVSDLHVGDEKQTGSNKFDMVIIIHLLQCTTRILPFQLMLVLHTVRKKY